MNHKRTNRPKLTEWNWNAEPHLGVFLRVGGELLENGERFIDFGVHGVGGVHQMKKLDVVHLKQHTGDLSSELRLRSKEKQDTDDQP